MKDSVAHLNKVRGDVAPDMRGDGASLIQAWNAFIHNVGEIGRGAWLDKLNLLHNRFEKRTSAGVSYKVHRLSREAGLL